ncbi:hypothetical protein [Tenacibaculum halocynthiae]|uniref:hypothetical protein n=1 Tax=Tenacibaculum halocynthiae TaxID=1254437 RepID=UPI003D6541A8
MDTENLEELKKLTELPRKDIEKFDKSFKELEKEIGGLLNKYEIDEFDEFCIDNINLFYSDDYGFPKELYKGIDDDEKNNFITEIVRQIKITLWRICKELNESKSVTAVKNFTLSGLAHKVAATLTTVDPLFISIIVFSYLEFSRSYTFESLCEMFEE